MAKEIKSTKGPKVSKRSDGGVGNNFNKQGGAGRSKTGGGGKKTSDPYSASRASRKAAASQI